MSVDGRDAVEQPCIGRYGIKVSREPRGELTLQFLHVGVGVGTRQNPKDTRDPVQEFAGLFQREDRIFERRGSRIGSDLHRFRQGAHSAHDQRRHDNARY